MKFNKMSSVGMHETTNSQCLSSTAAAISGRHPPLRARREAPASVIYILAVTLVAASISRLPLLDQFAAVKIGIFGAEFLSAMLLLLAVRQRRLAISLTTVAAFLVAFRFVIGSLMAKLEFGQSFEISAQESRFGLMLVAAPIVYRFLKEASNEQLKRFVFTYMIVLLVLDLWVYITLNADNLLILGLRTDNRFLCSILAPLVATAVIVVTGARKQSFALVAAVAMLVHSVLVTTSRMEILLSAGLVGFIFFRRWPVIRWPIYLAAIFWIFTNILNVTSSNAGVAGRNYNLALSLAWKAFPLGFGSVIDPTIKSTLGLPQDFFLSDYGVLLYVLRYGILGVLCILSLVILWGHFAIATWRIKGYFFLTVPLLLYLTFIPLLDYGSLIGGFLLAFMWLVPQLVKNSYSRSRPNVSTDLPQF